MEGCDDIQGNVESRKTAVMSDMTLNKKLLIPQRKGKSTLSVGVFTYSNPVHGVLNLTALCQENGRITTASIIRKERSQLSKRFYVVLFHLSA